MARASEAKEPDLEDLLEAIPDEPEAAAAPTSVPLVDVHALLAQVRRDVEHAFHAELDRVERAVATHIEDLEKRITYADAELGRLAKERAQLAQENQSYESKWRALRDLAGVNDRP